MLVVAIDALIQLRDLNPSILEGHHYRTRREGPLTGRKNCRHDVRGTSLVLESDMLTIPSAQHPEVAACQRFDKVVHLAGQVLLLVVVMQLLNHEGNIQGGRVESVRAVGHGEERAKNNVHPAEHQARDESVHAAEHRARGESVHAAERHRRILEHRLVTEDWVVQYVLRSHCPIARNRAVPRTRLVRLRINCRQKTKQHRKLMHPWPGDP